MATVKGNSVDEIINQVRFSIENEILKLVNRLSLRGVRIVQDIIKEKKIVAWGNLRKSISAEVKKRVNGWLLRIYSGSHYAVYAHEGTRPHMPPVYKIRDWVRKKGLAGVYSVKSRRRLGNRLKQHWEDHEVAFLIARKIANKGTKGVKFFNLALKQLTPVVEQEIQGFSFG